MTARPALLLTTLALLAAAPDAQRTGGDPTRPAPMPSKPDLTVVTPRHQARVVDLKLAHGSDARARDGVLVGAAEELAAVNSLLVTAGAVARPRFAQSEAWLAAFRASGEARGGIALHDLNLFFRLELDEDGVAGPLCDALNRLGIVALAWPAQTGGDPSVAPSPVFGPPALGTPSFENQQDYKGPAPDGIEAFFANTFSGGRGVGTTIIDVETGWTDDHEDLIGKIQGQFVGAIPASNPWDHGTAVLGELIGEDNGFGVRGIVWEADAKMATHSPIGGGFDVAAAAGNAAAAAGPGDVVVLEVQCYGTPPGPFPCEHDPAVFAIVQAATANGVHVFAAAGNGSHDLDSPSYGGAFDLALKDSGAVLVGATDGVSLATAGFSNYGSRITSNGWGDDVVTTGYGDLYDGGPVQAEYTDTFSGTSSATPIVTGAGIALNAIHREAFGAGLSPIELRDVLASTGTPQVGGGAIGTRPNLRAAIRSLAVPEIEVAGTALEGGPVEIKSYGTPGDSTALLWSPGLTSAPLHLAPFGYLYLDPAQVFGLSTGGPIGADGTRVDTYTIPSGLGLSGKTIVLQGVQVFLSGPGGGSLSNYDSFRIL